METTQDLEFDLNSLINEYGLISVLEALRVLVDNRAVNTETIAADSPDESLHEQVAAFRDVARSLAALTTTLPPELDFEIALEQITHTSTDLGSSDEMLSYGQFS